MGSQQTRSLLADRSSMILDSVKKGLLEGLADFGFHSGTDLAAASGISRTAVWKALHELESLGLEIAAVPGRGYRLVTPLELLSATAIASDLSGEAQALLAGLEIHDRLDSTNSHLKQAAAAGCRSGSACLAETQTAGRGRIGRSWVSPFGANVYLSVLWHFENPSLVSGLSLAAGVAIVRALEQAGVGEVGLKWPNDILWRDRKIGGLLLEVAGEAHGRSAVIVGLGLNRYIPPVLGQTIDQDWADLSQASGNALPSRNRLIALVLNELMPLLRDYPRRGLPAYVAEWRRHHRLAGRPVTVHQGENAVRGTVADVTDEGLLVVRCEDGSQRQFAAGDVRLRPAGD